LFLQNVEDVTMKRCNMEWSSGCPLWNKEEKNVEKTYGSPPTLYLLNETKIKWKISVGWWVNSLFSWVGGQENILNGIYKPFDKF
jgi:hypothetical protein